MRAAGKQYKEISAELQASIILEINARQAANSLYERCLRNTYYVEIGITSMVIPLKTESL
jgi:hypothetical protein